MATSVVFMGTPNFAVPSLAAVLTHGYDVIGVVTQPDRDAKSSRTMRARQEVNSAKYLSFNIREAPETILLSLFTMSNAELIRR